MVCNSGVSLIPAINGKTLHFVNAGLYDALFIMQDTETKTLWKHITGEAVYGELAGHQLPISNLLQMNAAQALAMDPNMRIAISDRPYGGNTPVKRNVDDAKLMDMFEQTLGTEDTRRPRMEMGLGVWTGKTRRYYPVNTLREKGKAVIDIIDGQNTLVYLDPVTSTPGAIYVETGDAKLVDKEIRLGNGQFVRSGVLVNQDGKPLTVERPNQIFTRWYGYSLSFPDPEIYE